jgi:hypothetical protein
MYKYSPVSVIPFTLLLLMPDPAKPGCHYSKPATEPHCHYSKPATNLKPEAYETSQTMIRHIFRVPL